MNKWTLVLTVCAVLIGLSLLTYPLASQEVRPDDTSVLMKKKLEYAQKVLEGLTLNDLKKVAEEGGHLVQVRKEASFRVIKTPEYDQFAEDFQRASDAMIKAAQDKNLEAAKLHYLGVTLSCFNCHAYVRDNRKRG